VRRPPSPCPWDICTVSQTAPAAPWRGREITVRCAASVDARHEGDNVQLAVRVLSPMPDLSDPQGWSALYRRRTWRRATTASA
jgi:hypothetical protein